MKIRREQLQPLYHMLVEDVLWMEFAMDFEDFKHTVMHHQLLRDQSIVQQMAEIDQDLLEYFDQHFYESD